MAETLAGAVMPEKPRSDRSQIRTAAAKLMRENKRNYARVLILTVSVILLASACSQSPLADDQFTTLPVGATLPTGQECAQRVSRSDTETVPENTGPNHAAAMKSPMPVWADFTEQANQRFTPRIDGKFSGTTKEILEWGACKWGLDAEILRAVAYTESDWKQSTTGDESDDQTDCAGTDKAPCPTSFGILQLKHLDLPGSYPNSRTSTAFNVDYYGARLRACYEGWVTYLGGDYGAGDLWGCIGWHYSGEWKDVGSVNYVRRVKRNLISRSWQQLPSSDTPSAAGN